MADIDPNELQDLAIRLGQPYAQPADAAHNELGASIAAPTQQPQQPDLSISAPQRGTLEGDKAERSRMLQTGAGVDQISGKIQNSSLGENHPVLGKILGGLAQGVAKAGDVGLSAIAPSLAINLPGSEFHHQQQLRSINSQIGAEQKEGLQSAQTADQNAQPELKQDQLDLNEQKLDETTRQHDQQLREHGFKTGPDGKIVPLPYEEMSEPQQAVYDLKGSQEEEEEAQAALKKVQADPNSPQARAAQQRIDNAKQTRAIAMQRLGLSEKQFELRSEGTVNGVAPAGSLTADDGRSVGTAFQHNVLPTSQQRDAAGRAEIGEKIRTRLLTQLQNPAIRDRIGPLLGRAANAEQFVGTLPADLSEFGNDLKSYAAFQAGMHPVRGIGGLQYFDKVMGGLGQTPEQMMGKFQSNHNTAQDVIDVGKPKTAGSHPAGGGPPAGATHIVPGSDGQMHYTDGKKDLGVVTK